MDYQKKLIEGNFPCQQVGAETKRERGASSALPPLYFLHVWWARRPLTPSRAAVLGSILPADTDPNEFLKALGIVKKQVIVGDTKWTLVGKNLELIESDSNTEYIPYSVKFEKAIEKENERRLHVREQLTKLAQDPTYAQNDIVANWLQDNQNISWQFMVPHFNVVTVPANPACINDRIALASSNHVIEILGGPIKIDPEDLYAYGRAYESPIDNKYNGITVLDPTSGGGSIPFEAARLGCNVIANDLNPVATAIEKATLEYPAKYGKTLIPILEKYGDYLSSVVAEKTKEYYYFSKPIGEQREQLLKQCCYQQDLFEKFDVPEYDQQGLIYCRTVVCPNCGERAPLLNSFALSKKKDGWMVLPKIEVIAGKKHVRFIPTKLKNGRGPHGEDPEAGTVKRGVGTCIFCNQAIDCEEIKLQARGESQYGKWEDLLYCVVGVRMQPKIGKDGKPMIYASGIQKGKIRTEKYTFFREPTQGDYDAIEKAQNALEKKWSYFENRDLIPLERIPIGYNTNQILQFMGPDADRWCDMFTPRQLLGHLTAMDALHSLIPEILDVNGREKGIAIIHYLQYMVDKCLDYNSRQTRWENTRSVIKGTFGRHDFSPKWTFGEMIYTGPSTALSWGKSQIIDAYQGISDLLSENTTGKIKIINGSAANMNIDDNSVDIICVDPPYYNNVQYAELSDYFYVWQKKTFRDLYPEFFGRYLTNKRDEAVANPVRNGGNKEATLAYENLMGEIFAECRRVLKEDGIMTMMFTHKTQEAWETLTRALIENGWIISASFPVDSESAVSLYQKDMAAAASSIFLACRKRDMVDLAPTAWVGFGGTGVLQKLREAVQESLHDFENLHLNAVDEMVASYGSALKVLSENWPVMDGNDLVTPIRAMQEASTIVAQYQMTSMTKGRLKVEDLAPEAGIALTMFGIYGMGTFPFDDALSLSKSLNIRLENKSAGYHDEGRMIGINDERTGRSSRDDESEGYFAPLVKKGNKLRLVMPEERNPRRLDNPQNEWDILQGLIMSYREGDIPVARGYLQHQAEGFEAKIIDILRVWTDGCGSEDLRKEAQRILFGLK